MYGEEQGIARVGCGGHTCAYLTRHDGSPRLLCLTLVAFSTAGRPYHTEFATVPFGGKLFMQMTLKRWFLLLLFAVAVAVGLAVFRQYGDVYDSANG